MFFAKIKDKVFDFVLNKQADRQAKRFLWLFILFYIALFLFLVFKRYYYFSYNVSDLAIFNQTFFNTLHGRWFEQTITLNNYLGDHFSPIILLLLPIYFLLPSPLTLLALQTIGLSLAAWPLFYLTKDLVKNNKVALLVAASWLLNPMLQGANLDESHLLYLVPLFVFWAAYFYRQNKFYYFLLFFILALLVREDIAFIMFAWGILAGIDKKSKQWIIVPLVLSSLYFLGALSIIKLFSGNNSYKFFVFYSWLGGNDLFSIIGNWLSHPLSVILHLFSWTNISSILIILLPLLYLPLIKPKYLLLAVLPFLQLAMSSSGVNAVAYMTRFCLLFLPGIFLALIFSLEHIQARKPFWFSKFIYKNFAFSKFLIVLTLIYFVVFLSPAKQVAIKKYDKQQSLEQQSMLLTIPKNNSVAATNNFLPRLSSRQFVYSIDYVYFGRTQLGQAEFRPVDIDYLLLDYSEFITTVSDAQNNQNFNKYWPQMPAQWRGFLQSYGLVRAENNILLWQKKKDDKLAGLKFYELQTKDIKQAGGEFLFSQASVLNQSHRVFKLSIQNIGDPNKNYLVRFYHNNTYFDMPLDYGLMSAIDWQEKIASFYYYLDPKVEYFQIFSWQGINKLGLEQEVYLDKKTKAIIDKTAFSNN